MTAVWALKPAEARRATELSKDPAKASDVAKAAGLLMHYVGADKTPEVVRRPVESLGGLALIDLLSSGDTEALLRACQEMFRFEYVDC